MLFCHGHGRFSSSSTSAGSGLFGGGLFASHAPRSQLPCPWASCFHWLEGQHCRWLVQRPGSRVTFESQVGDATWESVRILHNQRNVVRLEQGGDPCQFNSQSSTDVDCSSSAVALLQSEGRLTRDSGSGSTLSCQICQIQSAS